MTFILVSAAALLALGIVAALVSRFADGSTDTPIVGGHDCASCSSIESGDCKIGCLIKERDERRRQAAHTETSASAVLILAVTAATMLSGCSAQKNTAKTRFWHSFTAKYNAYYNGNQAYIDGMNEKETGLHDDFTTTLPLYAVSNKKSRETGKGKFDIAIEKSEKAIKQHSIKARPEWKKSRRKTAKDREWLSRREYNPFIWKAWLLLGKAQFQKGAFDEAAATFNYMSRLYQTQPMQYGIARAWLTRCYTELGWLYDAEDVARNMNRDSIHYRAQSDWNQTLAHYHLAAGEPDKALPLLRKVVKKEHHKLQRARIWYIIAQTEAALGHRREAYKAYQRVAAQNPPYEMEFNARIAQTEVMAKGNSKAMIARLNRMARSDKNKDYLDQVYYAIGNIYLNQRDTTRAIAAYEKGREKATRSGIEKGVLLLTLGNIYWQQEKFSDAQGCYGEAIGLLDKDRDDYDELAKRSKVLDELVPYTDAIHLQDSLQELAAMPEKQRLEAIDRVIEELKKKEKEEKRKQQEAAVEQATQRQTATGRNQPQMRQPIQQGMQQGKDAAWYFYNQQAVSQGKQQFVRLWGKRENTDDWQRNNKTVVNLAQTSDEEMPDSIANDFATDIPEGGESLAADSANVEANDSAALDPHNREYYLAQIPFSEEDRQASDLIIQDGLFHSGVIFKDKLENLRLSEKQFVRLTSHYPDFEQMDQAWYHLFLLYSRQRRQAEADSCLERLTDGFPDSEYTTLLNDPYFAENARFGEHIEDSVYAATYEAFKAGTHTIVAANEELSAQRFPLGEHRPKFIFVNALSKLGQGDAKACVEGMTTVVEKFPQSEVTPIAGMIIKGVQQGRMLVGDGAGLTDIWSARSIIADADSTSTDTLDSERLTPYTVLIAYEPDSLTIESNQLLYLLARYNFTNFLVRSFELQVEHALPISRMAVGGFLNFDEARQYARRLTADDEMRSALTACRVIIISDHNLNLLGTRYSFADYEKFYHERLAPLNTPVDDLLNTPTELPKQEEEETTVEGEEQDTEQQQPQNYDPFEEIFQ